MLKPAKGDLSAEDLEKLKTDYEQVADDVKELASDVIWLETRIKEHVFVSSPSGFFGWWIWLDLKALKIAFHIYSNLLTPLLFLICVDCN